MITRAPLPALFTCAAATLGLIFVGIHNAWDTVTYLTVKYGHSHTDDGTAS
jgi:hypothetical protein